MIRTSSFPDSLVVLPFLRLAHPELLPHIVELLAPNQLFAERGCILLDHKLETELLPWPLSGIQSPLKAVAPERKTCCVPDLRLDSSWSLNCYQLKEFPDGLPSSLVEDVGLEVVLLELHWPLGTLQCPQRYNELGLDDNFRLPADPSFIYKSYAVVFASKELKLGRVTCNKHTFSTQQNWLPPLISK